MVENQRFVHVLKALGWWSEWDGHEAFSLSRHSRVSVLLSWLVLSVQVQKKKTNQPKKTKKKTDHVIRYGSRISRSVLRLCFCFLFFFYTQISSKLKRALSFVSASQTWWRSVLCVMSIVLYCISLYQGPYILSREKDSNVNRVRSHSLANHRTECTVWYPWWSL